MNLYNFKTKLSIEPESNPNKEYEDFKTYYPLLKFNLVLIRDP